jgi:hypothetical protein
MSLSKEKGAARPEARGAVLYLLFVMAAAMAAAIVLVIVVRGGTRAPRA